MTDSMYNFVLLATFGCVVYGALIWLIVDGAPNLARISKIRASLAASTICFINLIALGVAIIDYKSISTWVAAGLSLVTLALGVANFLHYLEYRPVSKEEGRKLVEW